MSDDGLECIDCGVSQDSHGKNESEDCGNPNPEWIETVVAMRYSMNKEN
jgi:hypothetical protein